MGPFDKAIGTPEIAGFRAQQDRAATGRDNLQRVPVFFACTFATQVRRHPADIGHDLCRIREDAVVDPLMQIAYGLTGAHIGCDVGVVDMTVPERCNGHQVAIDRESRAELGQFSGHGHPHKGLG
jgi:hypothetical protein